MPAEVGLSARFLDFWEMHMEFDDWTGRMHTPPASLTALKRTMDAATDHVRARLGIVPAPATSTSPSSY